VLVGTVILRVFEARSLEYSYGAGNKRYPVTADIMEPIPKLSPVGTMLRAGTATAGKSLPGVQQHYNATLPAQEVFLISV
jgi:hypothetical protein